MKRIEFIAPVESMRGNLSGNQDLQYAPDNGKAWDATGEKASANNYAPRFVGAKRRDGLKYFSVRTKSTTIMSEVMREQMASLSIANTIQYSAMHNLAIQTKVIEWFEKTAPEGVTLRQYVMQRTMGSLKNKLISIQFNNTGEPTPAIANPFSLRLPDYAQSIYAGLSPDKWTKVDELIVKFWTQLGQEGAIKFAVKYGEQEFLAIGVSGVNFVDNYKNAPEGFDGTPAQKALYQMNGRSFGDSSPVWTVNADSVKVYNVNGDLTPKTLYGREATGTTEEDDVAVKGTDTLRADYIYTLK